MLSSIAMPYVPTPLALPTEEPASYSNIRSSDSLRLCADTTASRVPHPRCMASMRMLARLRYPVTRAFSDTFNPCQRPPARSREAAPLGTSSRRAVAYSQPDGRDLFGAPAQHRRDRRRGRSCTAQQAIRCRIRCREVKLGEAGSVRSQYLDGAACQNRTDDLLITSEMLYRLS
jgi:hypothetical protein